MTMFFVYKYENKFNNKVYIGKTGSLEVRRRRHSIMDGSAKRFHSAIKKYGIDSFVFTVLSELETEEESLQKEMFYISLYKSNLSEFGYNLTDGGEGHSGFKVANKEKVRRRNNWVGNKNPNFGKFGKNHPAYGLKRSEHTKSLISKAVSGKNNGMYGKPAHNRGVSPSEETKRKMSVSAKRLGVGENNPSAKLTGSNVLEIKKMISAGFKNKEISLKFKISKDMVSRIRNNKNWTHI